MFPSERKMPPYLAYVGKPYAKDIIEFIRNKAGPLDRLTSAVMPTNYGSRAEDASEYQKIAR